MKTGLQIENDKFLLYVGMCIDFILAEYFTKQVLSSMVHVKHCNVSVSQVVNYE